MSTNFSPTPAELNIVNQIFAQADPQKLGVLTGEVAVKVFGGAKLPPTTLGEIWNISDEDNKGWLPKKGVAIAVRLIGWAQKGEKITQALTNKPGPLAVIEGINSVAQHSTGMSLSRSPPPPSFPPLTPQDKVKFQNMFMKQGPFNGLLSGDKARDIFVKSKLSNEQLLKIWNLADTQDRGALDSTDFAIGMYFIQGVMTGKISFIPTSLPPGLYQQAGGASTTTSVMSNVTGNSGSFSPVGSVFPPQHTGQSQMMLQPDYTGLSSQPFRAPTLPARPNPSAHANGHAADWDVTAAEKASSDRYFDTLDTQKKGFIEGDVAVPFMLKSNLPGEVLAQVWDLADINNDGCLTKDGFAVAMHLIQKKLAGQDVPATLPQSLIPPSARAAVNVGSPFSPPHTQNQHQQPEPAIDLFSFDDTPPSSAVPHMQPMHTGSMQPQITGPTSGAFEPAQARRVASDPFSSAGPFHSSPHQDLLSDDDAHPAAASPPLQDRSAEIGNAKNQLQSTNRSLDNAKQEREALEQALANQASQLSTLQTQLSSAKAAYETEVNILAALKERRTGQIADIDKTRHELITAESNLSALRAEKAEIEGAFLRDKEEARDLHKRMVEAGQQAEVLKTDVEKLKKEAKQQKGLLAIARKQLSTKEAEKAKAEKEHEEAVAEVTSIGEEKDAIEAEIERLDAAPIPIPKVASPSPSASLMLAAAQPLPTTPEISSPSAKSNNPFERLAMTSSPPPQSTSPFLGLSNTIISSPSISMTEAASPSQSFQTPADATPAEAPKADSSAFDDFTSSFDHHDSTELSYLGDEANNSHAHDIPPSPTTANSATDFFMTPPTSAHNETSPGINAADRFPSMHDISANLATEKAPALALDNAASAPASAPAPVSSQKETDLNTKLQDLEIEESDSDDDTDSDDEPLAKTMDKGKARAADPLPLEEKEAPPAIALPAAAAAPAPSAFDDVFGSPNPAPNGNGNVNGNGHATTPFDLSSSVADKSEDLFGSKPLEATPTVAGVNEFDETLGKVTASAVATPVNFSFESSFDDTFDFGSNTQPAQSPVTQATAPEVAQKNDFDGIFGTASPTSFAPAPALAATNQVPNVTTPNVPKFESSFDSAFAGFDSAPPLTLDSVPKPSSPTVAKDAKPVPESFPSSPAQSPTQSAIQARISEIRAVSPTPRARSPPPRTNSPKPRVSTSSNKEPSEKPKEIPTRSSKLSIRLPFGRKKKHSEPMPPPPVHHLTPPMEQVSRAGTPSGEDDVESVKQLTDMGFSRSQAVDALEKYGYDVQKALNSLLGSQ